jgi:hypothetical protein
MSTADRPSLSARSVWVKSFYLCRQRLYGSHIACSFSRDVNETLGPETRPRWDPPKIFRDRDLWFRVRDETETFRCRDVFSRPFRLTVSLYYNNRYIHYTDNMRQLHKWLNDRSYFFYFYEPQWSCKLVCHYIISFIWGLQDQWLLSPPHNRAHSSHSPKNSNFRSLLMGHLSGTRIEAPIGSGEKGRDLPQRLRGLWERRDRAPSAESGADPRPSTILVHFMILGLKNDAGEYLVVVTFVFLLYITVMW